MPCIWHILHGNPPPPLYQHTILEKCWDSYYKRTISNSMEKTFYRLMVQLWAQSLSLIFSWLRLRLTAIIDQHSIKPLVWKRYIDDVFSLWDTNREEIDNFIEHANNYHPTIKFTADMSDKEIIFLDTCIYRRSTIWKGIYPWHAYLFQAYWDIPVHTFQILSPTARQKRLRERWRPETTKN